MPPVPWRLETSPKRVGLICEFTSHLKLPDVCTRAVNEAASVLKSVGIEIVEIDINPLIEEIAINAMASFFKDQDLFDILAENSQVLEPMIEAYADTIQLARGSLASLEMMAQSNIISPRNIMVIRAAIKAKKVNQLFLKIEQTQILKLVIKEFEKANVDVALAYGLFPAPLLRKTEDLNYGILYTYIWNYLNFPTGAVPVTKVRKNEQYFEPEVNDHFDELVSELMIESQGLPIGIQVVGLPWRDELVLKTMELIEENLPK